MERDQQEGGEGRMGGKGTGNKDHNWQAQNRQGQVKNSIGNGEAKELTYTTDGRELGGNCWREWRQQAEGCKGGKIGTTVIA